MISHEELVAVAEGVADPATEKKVLLAALQDPALRERLRLLEAAESDATVPTNPAFTARAAQLQNTLHDLVADVAREASPA